MWKIISSLIRMEYFSSLIIRDETYLDISLLVQRRLFQVELFTTSKTESFWLRMADARGMLPQSFVVDVTLTSRIFLLMTNCVSWSSGPGLTMAWRWTWSKWGTGQTSKSIWRVLSLSWSLQKPREMWLHTGNEDSTKKKISRIYLRSWAVLLFVAYGFFWQIRHNILFLWNKFTSPNQ